MRYSRHGREANQSREIRMSMGFKLLTPSNPKAAKGEAQGYWTFVLHLAPAKLSGFNVCPMATEGCKAACLNTAGRGGIMGGYGILTATDVANGIQNTIQKARIRKTRMFFESRDAFLALLVRDMLRAIKLANRKGLVPVFRLNGTSDIRWETVPIVIDGKQYANVMDAFPAFQFYDYTKLANRRGLPANYRLVFSLADGNADKAVVAMVSGMNVAVVFRNKATRAKYMATRYRIPGSSIDWPVLNGDLTDLRFRDPHGFIVGLYAKGNAKKDASGFVVD
jgi:hypothetical protein